MTQHQIELSDAVGQSLRHINTNESTFTIDILTLPKGLYILKIKNKNNELIEMKKVIKQ